VQGAGRLGARAGLGTAIVPRSFTAELAAPAGVLDLTDAGLTMTLGAYTRPGAVPPAAGALVDLGVSWPPRLAVT
jgi:DNA-binding transcriptional LysR family regulator